MVKVSGAPEEIQLSTGATCREILSKALSGKKFKEAVACRCEDRLYDLGSEVDEQCGVLEPVSLSSPEGLKVLRHSAAHIMAEAVKTIFPSARVTIGPDIEHGFYYDFDYERPFTPEDLEKIEAEMARSIAQDQPFERVVMSREEAKKVFLDMNETYKLEILDELEEDEVSLYRHGDFIDLCRGPHVPSTGYVKSFKLTSVAGAYWRGDEKRPMLQRIYGTAFASDKELKKHLTRLEEARKRDHRKLGAQLDLFSFSEEAGPGMPIFHPKGALIRTILEDFERKEHLRRGYQIVQGPQILRRELWEKSGHYDNYRENMYFTHIDEQVYGVKPMNCLSHMLIYKSKLRSYRDLPLRYFELGRVHRHEKSGVLHGLLRVREFTQDDAHILCRPDQLQDEITGVVNFVRDVMGLFGFEYVVEVSTRPEKHIGSSEAWEKSTRALTSALDALDMPYEINPGDGAFYGPKIDIKLKDALDRKWQCATVQCDFTLPERFDLTYTGEDGRKYRPVMLHRVVLGAIERFLGVLIEHYGGAFPTWLAPVQARIMNITDAQAGYVHDCADRFRQMGIRVEVDDRNEKLGYKVREAQMEKIPYVLVAGDQEVQESGLNVRLRGGKNLGLMSIQEVADQIFQDMDEPFKKGGLSYRYLY
ncbi:threonyl-tRNA synthetase [Desulfonatronospira thiodismutans ASO3-1]|uniref:Threonine--tRNA ligase n=1 Tax=Desulfonatronospira thiodismutans ASO3-1 TaxID=555779 RepID=D6SRM4_9BACT|nr:MULTISPECIES: threonine--tRNA ligase [Desulfonatronospira]EFI33340.1 threonyl-tRNA synthetase [Desulfonatronospira thiodismutans ASO3-1]RQD77557.1 MAG: threonine--tRNA ligase [Desulfonatronospira sp. MSAO_Bac3]